MKLVGLATLLLALSAASASPATAPGYVRLSQGDLASFTGYGLSCTVETVEGNPSQVAGIECGKGEGGRVIGGSTWMSLQLPDDVVAGTAAGGRPLGKIVYSRPAHPTYRTAIGVPGFRVLPVLPPRVIDVHDTGIWCSAQVSHSVAPNQRIVACVLQDASGRPKDGSYGFVVSAKVADVVRVQGSRPTVVWSRKQ